MNNPLKRRLGKLEGMAGTPMENMTEEQIEARIDELLRKAGLDPLTTDRRELLALLREEIRNDANQH